MSKKGVKQSNRTGRIAGERADFTSFVTGHSSYMERNWARVQAWAAVERGDLQPAPMLTDAARAALAEERKHGTDDHR